MKREWKEKWLEALRSGRYQQGRSALRRTNGTMCCLGVLCDLVDPSRWGEPGSAGLIPFGDSDVLGYPPPSVLEETGDFNDCILASRNDNGDTFEQIADYIEANF